MCINKTDNHILINFFTETSSNTDTLYEVSSNKEPLVIEEASTNIGDTISAEDQQISGNTALSFSRSSDSTTNIKESLSTSETTVPDKEVSTYKGTATSKNKPISSEKPDEELASSSNAALISIDDAMITETATGSVSTNLLYFYSCSQNINHHSRTMLSVEIAKYTR